MQRLYYVRHGECELNALKMFAGQTESPLTELGKQQAAQTAEEILSQQLKIDKIVSSTLWRANESAVIIAEHIGYPKEAIVTSNLFMERDFGMLEGTLRTDFFDAYSYEDLDNAPRAESLEQLHERATQAYEFIKALPEDNVLVVGHSGFFRAFKRAVNGNTIDHEYTSPFSAIKNGKVYTIIE